MRGALVSITFTSTMNYPSRILLVKESLMCWPTVEDLVEFKYAREEVWIGDVHRALFYYICVYLTSAL